MEKFIFCAMFYFLKFIKSKRKKAPEGALSKTCFEEYLLSFLELYLSRATNCKPGNLLKKRLYRRFFLGHSSQNYSVELLLSAAYEAKLLNGNKAYLF